MKIANREIDDDLMTSYLETVLLVRQTVEGKRSMELIGVYNEIRRGIHKKILKQAGVSSDDIGFTISLAEFVDSVL